MGRLIKYELKKQQISRNIILALLLVLIAILDGKLSRFMSLDCENDLKIGQSLKLSQLEDLAIRR